MSDVTRGTGTAEATVAKASADTAVRAQMLDFGRIAVGVVLVGWAAVGQSDTDIWGHMRFGLDFLSSHRIPARDVYSFTSDQPWVNHEWLWDVVTAAIYRTGGLTGLLVLRVVLIGSVMLLVDRATRAAPPWARFVTLLAVAVAAIGQWQSTRPQMITLVLYAVVMSWLDARWLPALFALWANLHGGWIFGLGAVGVRALLHPTRRRILLATACGLATLVNPYGWNLWLAIAEALRRGWADVSEWAPVWWTQRGVAPLILWLVVIGLTGLLLRVTRIERRAWAWPLITLVAAGRSRRLMALAALTIVFDIVRRWRADEHVHHASLERGTLMVGLAPVVVSCGVALSLLSASRTCFPPIGALREPEPDAVAFLRNEGIRGRAAIFFDYGEYAIWHVGDLLRVSIDNRRETVYSDAVVRAHQAFYRGEDPDYPSRIGADLVWMPRTSMTIAQLEARGWIRRFDGPRTIILSRQPGPVTMGREAVGTPCFPNP